MKLVWLLLVLVAGPALAGLEFTYEGQGQRNFMLQVSDTTIGTAGGFYDVSQDQIVVLRPADRGYSALKGQQLRTLITTAAKAKTQLAQLGDFLPAQLKTTLEQQASQYGDLAEAVEFRSIGEASYQQITCQKYEVFKKGTNPVKQGELCLASVKALKIQPDQLTAIQTAMSRFASVIQQQAKDLPVITKGTWPLAWQDESGVGWQLKSVAPLKAPVTIPADYQKLPLDFSLLRAGSRSNSESSRESSGDSSGQ